MNDKRWVQHMSGQGEKWEVDGQWVADKGAFWQVQVGVAAHADLPKSEYVLCPQPEQWEDVTDRVVNYSHGIAIPGIEGMIARYGEINGETRYRLRKIDLAVGSAFIVERKVQS